MHSVALAPRTNPPSGWPTVGAAVGMTMGALTTAALWAILHGRTQAVPADVDSRRRWRLVVGSLLTLGATAGAYVGAAPHQRDHAAFGAGLFSAIPQGAMVVAGKNPADYENLNVALAMGVGQFVLPLLGAALGGHLAPSPYATAPVRV